MYARLAKLHEVHLVFSNLSESFRSELAEASISIEEAQRKLEDCVKSGMALSLLRGDELLALLGYEIDDGIAYTSMPSTPAFFRPDTVRFGKRIMAELQTRLGNIPVMSCSYSFDGKVRRWFELMGFQLIPEEGLPRMFLLSPQGTGRP